MKFSAFVETAGEIVQDMAQRKMGNENKHLGIQHSRAQVSRKDQNWHLGRPVWEQ